MAKDLRSPRGPAERSRHRLRFRAFLFLSYGLLAALPLLVLSLLGTELYLDARRAATEERLRVTSEAIALTVSAFLEDHRRLLGLAARGVESIDRSDPAELDAWLARAGETAPGLLTLILTDETGTIVASAPLRTADGGAIRGVSVADRSYFQRPMEEGRPYLSQAFRGRGFGSDPIVAVSEPILGADGRAVGVIEASLDLSRVADLVDPHVGVAGRRVVVADSGGSVVYASPNTGLAILDRRPRAPICETGDPPGEPAVLARAVTTTAGWTVEVCRPADLLYAELRPIRRLLVGALLGGLVLSLGLAWFGSSLAARPLVESEERSAQAALRDSLTGLGNRSLFFDRLELEVAHARRDGTVLALLFLDLDDFKAINDTHGHAAGDAVLRSVADALRSHLRRVDTIARLGGDELAVLLPAVGSAGQAFRIAHHLVAAIGRPVRLGDEELRPRVSVGVSLFPEDAETGEDLLAAADRAMYAAKRSGAGRVHREGSTSGLESAV